jgi:CRISPR/Cas system CSM-associated protein Csm2 small subunit
MVANIGKMLGKIVENGFNKSKFAKAMGMSTTTLKRKMYEEKYNFTIDESKKAKELLALTSIEYLEIFIG